MNGINFDCVSECSNYTCHAVIRQSQCGYGVFLCLQMVWENGCVVIVMLTPLTESGVKQCYHYWPDEGSNLYHIYEVLRQSTGCKQDRKSMASFHMGQNAVSSGLTCTS